MRFLIGVAGVIVVLAGAAAIAVALALPTPADTAGLTGDVERGGYVARLAGCVACHTDEDGDGALLAGGAPIVTPFGSFRAPNITPHADGIAGWTQQDLSVAMTAGRSPSGAPYYPVFPFDSYAHMLPGDIADLWAYLASVEAAPDPRADQAHDLAFPYNLRPLMYAWQALFVPAGPIPDEPDRSDAWNRGRYIVNGPGHCTACHTPRNALGAMDVARHLEGGPNGPDGERVPAITPGSLADEGWTADDIAFGLEIGMTPLGDFFGGSMAEVVRLGTGHLTPEDRAAIGTYLMGDP